MVAPPHVFRLRRWRRRWAMRRLRFLWWCAFWSRWRPVSYSLRYRFEKRTLRCRPVPDYFWHCLDGRPFDIHPCLSKCSHTIVPLALRFQRRKRSVTGKNLIENSTEKRIPNQPLDQEAKSSGRHKQEHNQSPHSHTTTLATKISKETDIKTHAIEVHCDPFPFSSHLPSSILYLFFFGPLLPLPLPCL